MKAKTFILSFLMMFCSVAFGQGWGETPNKYSSNMTIVTQIMIDNELQGNNIEIGAFCGDEFRGSARPTVSESQFKLVYLTIVGESGDAISYKLYDHAKQILLDYTIENAIVYQEDAHIGSAANLNKVTGLLEEEYITRFTSVAETNGVKYGTLQGAINACVEGDNTIKLLANISDDVTVNETAGVNIEIQGNKKEYSGTINIVGNSTYGDETLSISNVKFVTSEKNHDFIWSDSQNAPGRYCNNVSVDKCYFVATGDAKNTAVGLRIRQGKNIDVTRSVFEGMHSAMQMNGTLDIYAVGLEIKDSKNGISASGQNTLVVEDSKIFVEGYGVRTDGKDNSNASITGTTITANLPVVVRKTTGDYKLNAENNEFEALNDNKDVTFTTGDDEAAFEAPKATNATATITGDVTTFGFEARIGNVYYTTFDNALEAAEEGKGNTITVLNQVVIKENKTYDLAGLTVTGATSPNQMFRIQDGANVTVMNANITNNSHYVFVLGAKDKSTAGYLTIENGTYVGETTVAHVVNGLLTIKGGEFKISDVDTYDYAYLINCDDPNFKNGKANVEIKGGKFYSFNPENNKAEGAGTDFCAEGYFAVEASENVYEVVEGLIGEGTEAEPFLIRNLKELKFFRDHVNAGETRYNAAGKYVALAANIDMATEDWSVNIGDDCNYTFDGIFDGKNHTISNLNSTETAPKADGYICTGLFGAIYGNAVVKNLTIENVNINTADFTGNNVSAVVGFAYTIANTTATIANVTVKGNISINAPKAYAVGTIVGYSYEPGNINITDCAVEANDGSSIVAVSGSGAIIGHAAGIVTVKSSSVNNIDITAKGLVGGLAGFVSSSKSVLDNNTVKNVNLTATEPNWVNSAAIAVGTMNKDGLTVANTTFENVNASQMVGSVYANKPTSVVPAVEARIGDVYYTKFDNALEAAEEGDTITVISPVVVAEDASYDLLGLTVEGANVYPIFRIVNDATMIVKNANIENADDYVFVLGSSDQTSAGNLTIENGTFTGMTTVASVTKGVLTINGGVFNVNDGEYGSTYLINCVDANYKNGSAKVYIYGGKFHKFNPENNAAEVENTNFCAEGYVAKYNQADDSYTVFKGVAAIGDVKYASVAAAHTAATAGQTITLLADVTEDVTIQKDLTIDGAGNNYTGNISVKGATVDVIVKNVNFINGTGYAITTNTTKSITVENCTVNNYGYGFLYANKSTPTVVVKNVKVDNANYGMHYVYGSNATLEKVTMTNVKYGLYIQNYASKTITVKNSDITSIEVWERDGYSAVQTFKFEGANKVGALDNGQYAKYVLNAVDATLAAPAGYDVKSYDTDYMVAYEEEGGVYKYKLVPGSVLNETKDKKYVTLQAAIEDADDNNTIVLLDDINLNNTKLQTLDGSFNTYFKVEGKTVTIDLNGMEISGTFNAEPMLVGVFSTENNGHLTLVDNSDEGTALVDLKSGNDQVYALIVNYEPGCSITIDGGTYKLDKAKDAIVYTGASLNEGGVTIEDGIFELGNVGTGTNGQPWIFNVKGQNSRGVQVNGGTFNSDINHQFWANEVYVPETLALRNNGNGTWTVYEAEAYVVETASSKGASPRKVGYETLTEAFAVAMDKNYTTVGLSKDITTDKVYTIKAGKTVTFDLNGKTLQGTDNTTKNFGLIQNNGTLTVIAPNGGMMTVVATVNSGWNRYSAVISNNPGATLTVKGGTIEHLGGTDMAYGIDALTNGGIGDVNTTIDGGTIKSTYRAVRQFLNSDSKGNNLTVNGGTLEGANKSIFFHDPSTKANNGTVTVSANAFLKGDVYLYVTAGSTEWPVEISIANAAFQNGSTVITGNVPKSYAVDQVDAIWTVLRVSTQDLVSGWNWFSHYVEGSVLDQLQNELGENGIMIKTRNAISEYIGGDEWDGTLQSTSPAQSYKINVNEGQDINVMGHIVDYTKCFITLDNRGWNYIGYPLTQEVSVQTALSGVEMASDGDLVKTRDGFAEYINGEWWGSLETMKPGVGYMYFRAKTNNTVDFTYTTSKESVKANVTTENNHWIPTEGQYANNMTMVAMLDIKGDNYEVAAFVNGEVRGSARPIYVESLDAYMFFLTIHGENVEEMTFKCYDIDTDTEYTLGNVMNYSNDAMVGSLKNPYLLSRGTVGLEEVSSFNIYPNPTTTDREINLSTTCDKVEVFNALGVKVAEYQNVDTIDAFETTGIYVIRVTNNGNVKHCRLVVK